MIKDYIKGLVQDTKSKNNLFKRNVIKEYLQILVLDFIYSHPEYGQLIFYGGSCLRHCFSLNRLSENLDFVDLKRELDLKKLAKDLEQHFKKNTDLKLITTTQKFRIYLKFPILHELKLSEKGETDLLFLKVEAYKEFDFCKSYDIEIIPLFKYNKSILIKTFDLPTLMATKVKAALYRKWEKTDKSGNTLIKVKGRDYFDLMWYLQKKIKINMNCLQEVENIEVLKDILIKNIENIDNRSIQLDLEALIDDKNFVKNLSKNIKNILIREINANLLT